MSDGIWWFLALWLCRYRGGIFKILDTEDWTTVLAWPAFPPSWKLVCKLRYIVFAFLQSFMQIGQADVELHLLRNVCLSITLHPSGYNSASADAISLRLYVHAYIVRTSSNMHSALNWTCCSWDMTTCYFTSWLDHRISTTTEAIDMQFGIWSDLI